MLYRFGLPQLRTANMTHLVRDKERSSRSAELDGCEHIVARSAKWWRRLLINKGYRLLRTSANQQDITTTHLVAQACHAEHRVPSTNDTSPKTCGGAGPASGCGSTLCRCSCTGLCSCGLRLWGPCAYTRCCTCTRAVCQHEPI